MAREPARRTEINTEDVNRYRLLRPLLGALHRDIQELAKKKQDGALTKSRVAMINRLLKDVKELLSKQPSAGYLDLLDEDAVPQNADALLIIGQYLSALAQYYAKYTYKEAAYPYTVRWITGQDVEDS